MPTETPLQRAIANRFTDQTGHLLLDPVLLGYIHTVLASCNVLDLDTLSDVTTVIAPLLHSNRITSSLEEAEEVVALLCGDAAKFQTTTHDTESVRLISEISIMEQVVALATTREQWQSTQKARNLAQQKLDYQVAQSESRARANLARRIAQGKATVFEPQARVLNQVIAVSQASQTRKPTEGIVLDNITIAYGGNVLLQDCDFRFHFGRRYSLIGRNGTGKSTLLRAIASGEVACIPDREHYRLLYVSQEITPTDDRVIDVVLSADSDYTRLARMEKVLLELGELLEEVDPSEGTLTIDQLSQALHQSVTELFPEILTDLSSPVIGKLLQDVYIEMEERQISDAKARASKILSGLQFTPAMQIRRTKEFSGGWLMRVSLARALFMEPHILFLDEPDNHLDTHAMLWLEDWLRSFPTDRLLVVVSHDTDFLNHFSTDIVLLCNQKLKLYSGDYDTFVSVRTNELESLQKRAEKQEAEQARIQTFVDRFRYNAKRASLVQSRLKMLNKMEALIVPEAERVAPFSFPSPPEPSQATLLEMRNVEFAYSQQRLSGFRLTDINLTICADSRIAICGANGSGKSTLLKLLCGTEKELSGVLVRSASCVTAIFWQHHTELLDLNKTPYQTLEEFSPGESEQEYRRHLGSFGLSESLIFHPNYTLSGGQKTRLNFALLTFRTVPTLLILDEPTNHLDIETRMALAEGLNLYQGAVVIVSHDAQLIQSVTDDIYVVAGGRLQHWTGDFQSYKQSLRDARSG
ncbi:ABC transporter, ATP-binding protein [Giardia muris]|uniref:ABC transporter, ATP-binding protein n=1 Tax=Giardia muris TaxID=5742 RepID=A0A4Z1STJ4_GIAMU|nr:ABC transporter, ATP-binding protein [Giardia muris]|eukprot:TNJ28315.1 ABC transporter, ATP-binding protein [Giardia muris]